ncbi:MAG: hypothetical protein GF331_02470 [Chitinivibrionales bacterium]|nr:hypothetical protein [Chitinivibrionales bacterium]
MSDTAERDREAGVQSESSLSGTAGPRSSTYERISLLDLLLILLARKRLITITMVIVSLAAVVGTTLMTKEYTATAVILPGRTSVGLPGNLGSLLGDLPFSGMLESLNLFSGSNNEQVLSILGSRRLADSVITRFDLEHRYEFHKQKKWYYETLIKAYFEHLEFEENELGNITVAYTDTSPGMAAEITNYIVGQVDTVIFQLAKTSARHSRQFFEQRLSAIQADMDSAHERFNRFRVEHGYFDLETQLGSTIEALAKVEAQRMALDVQIAQLQNRFGTNSNRVQELRRSRAVLSTRMKVYMREGGGRLVIALDSAPDLGVQYAHLYRDVKVQETLYNMVLQMYEQAKFMEVNNTPVVEVLEYAQVPEKKRRPKRSILCILIFSVCFAGVCSFVLAQEWYGRQRQQYTLTYRKLQKVFEHFRFRR